MSAASTSAPMRAGRTGPVRRLLHETAELGGFSAAALRQAVPAWRHSSQILRQAGILVFGTTLITLFLMFTIGGTCGLIGNYFLRSIGGSDYTGLFTALCSVRESLPVMFGYVFAAKVGCGLAAEIGAMRINDELDAFESVGLAPMRYVVATRLVATWIYIPIIFALAAFAVSAGAQVTVVHLIGEVSQGSFETVHWSNQSVTDYAFSLLKVYALGTVIVLVAAFYGYTVTGGPADVGRAVARSMVVNLILIHVLDGAFSSLFYGLDPRLPIGGGGS